MSRSIHQFFPRTKTGNTIPGAEYTVKDATSGLDVDIFDSADSETPKTQPYKADGNGKVLFYIEPGIYNIDSTDLKTGNTGSKIDVPIGVSRRELSDNNGVKQFDKTYATVADMKADISLQANGSKLINTVDYYSTQRGGGASYLIKTTAQAAADGDVYSATSKGNILLDSGVVAVLQFKDELSLYMLGFSETTSATYNREATDEACRLCLNKSVTIHLPDEDYQHDASQPVVVGADTTIVGGKGIITPVFSSPLPPASSSSLPDNHFLCYGGVFTTGDLLTRERYQRETYEPYMGKIVFSKVKIHNTTSITTDTTNFLHGIVTHAGVVVQIDCDMQDIPNTGYYNTANQEVYQIRNRCNGAGFLGGAFAKNATSNNSTQNSLLEPSDPNNKSRILWVQGCDYSNNFDEGVQYANCPFVFIEGNNCQNNGDRGIEGDSTRVQTEKTRENDQIWILNNDCRGLSGVSKFSITAIDGFNKDVFIGGNRLGRCINEPMIFNASLEGSVIFTAKNTFELDDNNLQPNCHGMYINAGVIDITAGAVFTGNHDRSALGASLLACNNDLGGGSVITGHIKSDVKFRQGVFCKVTGDVKIKDLDTPTSESAVKVELRGDVDNVEISGCRGSIIESGTAASGLLFLVNTSTHFIDNLILKDNVNSVGVGSDYPVYASSPLVSGRIGRLFTSGNYFHDYVMQFGDRVTNQGGLALLESSLDLPVLV